MGALSLISRIDGTNGVQLAKTGLTQPKTEFNLPKTGQAQDLPLQHQMIIFKKPVNLSDYTGTKNREISNTMNGTWQADIILKDIIAVLFG